MKQVTYIRQAEYAAWSAGEVSKMTVSQEFFVLTPDDPEPDLPPPSKPKRKYVPNGYAARPGTGPEGETCKTCAFKVAVSHRPDKHWNKCELRRANWTSGYGTDIKTSSPACSFWQGAGGRQDNE